MVAPPGSVVVLARLRHGTRAWNRWILRLTDADILDIVLAATARCFFSKTLDALGAQPDARYAELAPPIRDALTVGRPIAEP